MPDLPVTVTECHAEPPPKRKLELTCNVTNPAAFDICILDAWVRVGALDGLIIAEGRLFQSMHNRVDPAIIASGKQGQGAFHIELPAAVMHHIEQRRAGGDVKLRFYSRVLVCEVLTLNAVATLKPPYETQFGDKVGYFEYLIPRSEWLKLLKSLSWSELEILEIPSSRLRVVPSLGRALKRFEDAQQNYRNGDWEETMMNCRKAFEAIIQDASGELDMSKAHQVFVSILGPGEKADRFDKLAKSLGDFLHLGRHETHPQMSIRRADAEIALLLTGGLLTYLGQQ
ncbi:MAG: hypothetical protein ACE144_17005 [Thermodesulfobacteriota bacterium]